MPADFAALYASAPANQRQALLTFRAQNPPRHIVIDGARWEYIDAGPPSRAPTMLILVGGLRVADAAFRSIHRLKADFRVITPTYPGLETMAALADGLAGVLDAADVAQAHVLSGSFGGMLALSLAQRHPARLASLILSSTALPGPDDAREYRNLLRLMSVMPGRLVLNQMRDRLLTIIDPPADSREFWRAYLAELFGGRLSKQEALSTLRCMVDFADNGPRHADDLPGWQGRTLLIDSADDHTFDAAAQAALRALLPAMSVHTFTDAGHSPAMTKPDEFFALVRTFVHGDAPPDGT